METYVCTSLASDGSTCLEWVQTASFVALSAEDAAKISAAIIGVWCVAYGLRAVINFITKGSIS